jgi:anti-sigma factor RsiW
MRRSNRPPEVHVVAALRRHMQHHRRTVVCRAAVDLITDYLEGALRPSERRRVETHLANCIACTAYLEQMRTTIDVLGHLDPDDLPHAVLDELVDLHRRVSAA